MKCDLVNASMNSIEELLDEEEDDGDDDDDDGVGGDDDDDQSKQHLKSKSTFHSPKDTLCQKGLMFCTQHVIIASSLRHDV